MNKSENQIQPALVATIAGTSLALPAMYLLGILEPKGISSAPANSSYFLFLNALCVLVLFLFELKTMNTNNHGIKSSDQGIASAIITILMVFYMPILDRYSWQVLVLNSKLEYFYVVGLVTFAAGITIRAFAAKQLGKYFTHELQVVPNQKVISSGLYKYVRHPAYLGTLMLVVGFSWMFLSNIGLLLSAPMLFLALYRIKNEEKMLSNYFGNEYQEYMVTTKKIIPFLL
jgi:protein-S-isoprenylcysteine O-methyltransferase Ste14